MINKTLSNQCWFLHLVGALALSAVIASCFDSALAQSRIVPDTTLGDESSGVVPLDVSDLPIDVIDGGALRGVNLFHSFTEFNVSEGRGAYFVSPNADIQNILARVTGKNLSEMFGTLGTFGDSRPNLFLINPNGIIFGEKASLDVGGSFLATTANAIKLGNAGLFSASEPKQSNLLSINPSALLFNSISRQEIINRSKARNTVLGFFLNSSRSPSLHGVPEGLQVVDAQSLLLVGGNVVLDGGNLTASEGRIELGSVIGSGLVSLEPNKLGWQLGYKDVQNFGDVQISPFTFLDVSGNGAGSIQIQSERFLAKDSLILANTVGSQDAGNILVQAKNAIILDNAGIINAVSPEGKGKAGDIKIQTQQLTVNGDTGQITASTSGQGDAGNINIVTGQLLVKENGAVSASTTNAGNAGNIEIHASDFVEVIGDDSKIETQVKDEASGIGGNLLIDTKRLTVGGGAQISAGTFGTGKGGTLTVKASNFVDISGANLNGSPSGLFTATYGAADAGDLKIDTRKLSILNGGTVSASTAALLGTGQGGNLIINASESVEVVGSLKNEQNTFFSSLVSETGRLLSFTTGIEPALGGKLTIDTGRLSIRDGGKVATTTHYRAGRAGDLTVTAKEAVEVIGKDADGNISSLAAKTQSTGDAGKLTINTRQLVIRDGAEVSTSTASDDDVYQISRRGQGGALDITASDFVEVSGVNSGLTSLSLLSTGDAGDLTIHTERLKIRGGATVSASSVLGGQGGNLKVTAPDFVEVSGSGVSFDERFGLGKFTVNSSLSTNAVSIKDAGNLAINTGKLIVQDGGEVSATTGGLGKGGDIRIEANSVSLKNGALISSRSNTEQGNAGNIFLNVRDRLQSSDSEISTTSDQSSGGTINITAKDIRLSGDSDIKTSVVSGAGGGGDITLTANSIIAFDDSDILAFARDGKGGNITLNTPAFFGYRYKPVSAGTDGSTLNGNNRVDINASGTTSGIITIPDVSFIQNSLTDLQQSPIDTNTLIANSCIVRSSKLEGIFTITGTGGLPYRPGDVSPSTYTTGQVREVETASRLWKKGDPIIEPSGVYQLTNGQLVMSRECH